MLIAALVGAFTVTLAASPVASPPAPSPVTSLATPRWPASTTDASRAHPSGARTQGPDVIRLYARILRAADARTLDAAAFDEALASSDVRLRVAAARAIAQLAPSRRSDVLPRLRTLARDHDPRVAAWAVFGLGLAHDTASLGALATLARGSAAGASLAASAAWSLGEMGAPARDTLSVLLQGARPTGRPSSTTALLLAASKMKPVDVAQVAPYLASRVSNVQWAAAYAIARQRSPEGARALLELHTSDPAVLAEVAREVTHGITGDSLRTPAMARLRQLARAPQAYVRIDALRALGTYGTDARTAMVAGLGDRDALVRVAAAQSVAQAFGADAAAWRTAWNADTTYEARRALLESAATARIALPGDSLWRASPDWRLRAAALRAWGNSRDSVRCRAIALDAVRDPDGRVRAAAYSLLAGRDRERRDAAVQSALAAAAADPDSLARDELRDQSAPAVRRPPANVHELAWYENLVRSRVLRAQSGHPRRAIITTVRGPITLALFDAETPITVDNFTTLASRRYYDGVRFHRVVPAFVAQDGDPRGDGNGGPGYEIRDELSLLPYVRGAVGMALSGPDTGGSQYFLTLTPQPHLDGHYTVFGQVVNGFAAMDALVEGDTITSIRIVQ